MWCECEGGDSCRVEYLRCTGTGAGASSLDDVLRERAARSGVIALDDDESVGSDMKFKHITKDRYVETESDKGLTMKNAMTAVRLLRSQLNSTEKHDRRKKKRRRKKKLVVG